MEVDSRKRVALYNLGAALSDADGATRRCAVREVLAIVPGHEAARRNRDLSSRRGSRKKAMAWPHVAISTPRNRTLREAVSLDPGRTHAQAAIGIALLERGPFAVAASHLQAPSTRAADPAVPTSLGVRAGAVGRRRPAIAFCAPHGTDPEDADIARIWRCWRRD